MSTTTASLHDAGAQHPGLCYAHDHGNVDFLGAIEGSTFTHFPRTTAYVDEDTQKHTNTETTACACTRAADKTMHAHHGDVVRAEALHDIRATTAGHVVHLRVCTPTHRQCTVDPLPTVAVVARLPFSDCTPPTYSSTQSRPWAV